MLNILTLKLFLVNFAKKNQLKIPIRAGYL